MVPCRTHSMAPGHLTVLKEKLAANLLPVPSTEHATATLESLHDAACCPRRHGLVHVFGFRAQLQRLRHAHLGVQLSRWVRVDGERTIGLAPVHGNEIRPAAADDGNEGW